MGQYVHAGVQYTLTGTGAPKKVNDIWSTQELWLRGTEALMSSVTSVKTHHLLVSSWLGFSYQTEQP